VNITVLLRIVTKYWRNHCI